jgi:hypothetical protein
MQKDLLARPGFRRELNAIAQACIDLNAERTALSRNYASAIEVEEAFRVWREKMSATLLPGQDIERLIAEFSAQTAYVLIVRLLLVRIVEDKHLIPRVFTNGGLSVWFDKVEPRYLDFARGRGTDFPLDMAYASAQHIYSSFYSEQRLFDWYRPDRNRVIRIVHRLAAYDLSRVDHDVIGHIYGQYVEEEHKHESGLYYTPQAVVEYMLDRVGFAGPNVLGKRLLDLASGSGSFLVSAARRIVEAYRHYHGGTIPPDQAQIVVDAIRDKLFGLDINPFSCYLAETNLLIQILDLVKAALSDQRDLQVERFHIYNTDTLRYEEDTLLCLKSSFEFRTDRLPVEERVKANLGEFKPGFDYIVGNPPYVRADEGPELLDYRREIKDEHPIPEVQEVLERKWDLFVPFVALAHHLVRPDGH